MSDKTTSQLILFNKPFNTLSQFSAEQGDSTLADFIQIPDIYPAGRLDKDSEGLLLLTSNGQLQHQIANPSNKMEKTYWVQVEGLIDDVSLAPLRAGLAIQNYRTKPAKASIISKPDIWERNPPIRQRKNIPTSWIEIQIREGKNRQVRRMTAAIGYPTLRLIRAQIGPWGLGELKPGESKILEVTAPNPKIVSRRDSKVHNSKSQKYYQQKQNKQQ